MSASQNKKDEYMNLKQLLLSLILFLVVSCSPTTPPPPPPPPSPALPTLVPTPINGATPAPNETLLNINLSSDCNPFWHKSPEISNVSTLDEATEVLEQELTRWTRVSSPRADNNLYFTYLSPQVIEAIVNYNAVLRGMSQSEKRELLSDIERRLALNNTIAFLVILDSDIDSGEILFGTGANITLNPLEDTLALVNQRRERFAPYIEYSQVLIESDSVRGEYISGYVLFPRSIGDDCNPTINLANDHSFDIHLEQYCYYHSGNKKTVCPVSHNLWSYTLLPSIPLDQTRNIPLSNSVPSLTATTLNELFSLALTILEIIAFVL